MRDHHIPTTITGSMVEMKVGQHQVSILRFMTAVSKSLYPFFLLISKHPSLAQRGVCVIIDVYHNSETLGVKMEIRDCTVVGCTRLYYAKGHCQLHYRRLKDMGQLEIEARPTVCEYGGCDNSVHARGYCDKHYQRLKNTGQLELEQREKSETGIEVIVERIMLKVETDNNDCWNFTGSLRNGYGLIWNNGKHDSVHRVMYKYHVGEIPDRMFVLHHCDSPSCCNPDHLFIGNHQDNMKDRAAKGRSASGVENGRSKINKEIADQIRVVYSSGNISQRKLAKKFGVGKSIVSLIVRGESWI